MFGLIVFAVVVLALIAMRGSAVPPVLARSLGQRRPLIHPVAPAAPPGPAGAVRMVGAATFPPSQPGPSVSPVILLLSTSDTDLITARASGASYRWANPSRLVDGELDELLDGVRRRRRADPRRLPHLAGRHRRRRRQGHPDRRASAASRRPTPT